MYYSVRANTLAAATVTFKPMGHTAALSPDHKLTQSSY